MLVAGLSNGNIDVIKYSPGDNQWTQNVLQGHKTNEKVSGYICGIVIEYFQGFGYVVFGWLGFGLIYLHIA